MFKTAATKIAHNSTLPALAGNTDLRPLQDLIAAEKTVLISLQKLSVDFAKASEALRTWGLGEGDDLGDTLSCSTAILNHFSTALSQYATHGHGIRDGLKSIRTREEALDDLRRRRKNVAAKAESAEKKLSKMSPEHKNLGMQTNTLNQLRDEIRSMDSDIMTEEAALGDFKRATTRTCMGLKFGGLLECCEKGAIVGEYGKSVVAEIPEDSTQPGMARIMYYGRAQTETLVAEANRCVSEVVMSTVPSSGPRVPRSFAQQPVAPPPGDMGNYAPPPPSQGPDSWSPHHGHTMSQSSGPPNYLASPTNFGTGSFLGPSDTLNNTPGSGPGSPVHQQYPSQVSSPMPNYPQIESYQPMNDRAVDDFGVNQFSTSGPIDHSTAAGGRFATFPVKNRTGGTGASGFNLRDDPPSLDPSGEHGPSFSSSIAEALGGSPQQHPVTGPQYQQGGSFDNSAPSYQVTHAPAYSPPAGPPPGAAPIPGPNDAGLNPWSNINDNPGNMRNSQASDDSALLAYMSTPNDQQGHQEALPRTSDDSSAKHVRFGEVNEVNEDTERHVPQHAPREISPPMQDYSNYSSQGGNDAAGSRASHDDYAANNGDNRFENQRRIPPPSFDPDADERALNAAAAREISRELDSLNFSPTSPLTLDYPSYPNPTESGHELQSANAQQGGSPHSPLSPQSAPFTQRTVSPRPTIDTAAPPYTVVSDTSTVPMSPAQAYAQTHSPYTPTQPRSSFDRAPTPEQRQQQQPHSPVSPLTPRLNLPLPGPPSITLPEQQDPTRPPLSPMSSTSPYRTPPEYPRGLGAPPFAKSSSSLTSPVVPGGQRTISAAAFKRPPPRMMSGDNVGGSGGLPDTSPLALKKRLPSSPYPQRGGAPSALSREASPALQGRDRADSYSNNRLPPSAGETEDDHYDYINAYVNNGPPQDGTLQPQGGEVPQHQTSGYGQGRFATNLEGNLR